MKSKWNDDVAQRIKPLSLKMRVYTSQLLGQDENLVMHGGGNTSVKLTEKGKLGVDDLLYIKGSGWDLETIEEKGFAPVKMDALLKMVQLEQLSDAEMVYLQRASMTNPFAPNPSVEALLHALIPLNYVDHTHADAVVTITNTPDGAKYLQQIYGDRILVIPYVMPGFLLAKEIFKRTRNVDWAQLDGMILMNHGVFTFDDDAEASYLKMIKLVNKAERFLRKQGAKVITKAIAKGTKGALDLLRLAEMRKAVSRMRGTAVLASVDVSPAAAAFARLDNMERIVNRGPITPDHVIRTKRVPMVLKGRLAKEMETYALRYQRYFEKFNPGNCTMLDPAPRWGIWKNCGVVSFGKTAKEVQIIGDIARHTTKAIQQAEQIGGWKPLAQKHIFEMEYWELEQAKLKKSGSSPTFQGKISLVTGAANGIGKACVDELIKQGAMVAALDINPIIGSVFSSPNVLALQCDVTDSKALQKAVEQTVKAFGGLDLLVSNAGIFPPSMEIAEMDPTTWQKSLDLNLSSHQSLLQTCAPYLKLGLDPAIVLIASKNVPAPGPGASAYSVAKAGLTQLGRVAALEMGKDGIRVNMIHPNAVYDTGVWTADVLKNRAKSYDLSVEEYKTSNVLGVEVTSKEVATLTAEMLGPTFSKITGAQIPIDGGNDRVI
jgi:rhamnose utilization protein RhaD (predicted bifunctional aldolase and dehydrogenase)/NAD(P)-dependent dehydrogenase (short-subunit alcohol dehydrogenase family)